jgi:ribonuclease J
VFVPQSQRIAIKRAGEFERVNAICAHRIFPEKVAARTGELVLTFRPSMTRDLDRADCLDGARALWSLWPGYLDEPSGQSLRRWLERREIPLAFIHASGHASVRDLQRLAAAISPGKIVPIHTGAPERFLDLFEDVELHADGEWWRV